MLLQANVGKQSIGDGAQNIAGRLSRSAALIVDECQGRYNEQASRGLIFSACNQAVHALSALSTTATGFILNNPIGSNVQISLLDLCIALGTAPGGASTMGLAANTAMQAVIPTSLSTESVISTLLGSKAAGVGTVWYAATLATAPTYIRAIGGGAVAASSISPAFIRDEIAGQIVLLPGTCVTPNCNTTAVSALTSMAWVENAL